MPGLLANGVTVLIAFIWKSWVMKIAYNATEVDVWSSLYYEQKRLAYQK